MRALVWTALLWALTFSPSLGQQDARQDQQPQSRAYSNEAAPQEPVTTHCAPNFKIDTGTYHTICDQPRDKDYADLCQQWRSAQAAERQVQLNIAGLVLLAGTLAFTGWAALAASRGAKAALATVKEAQNATAAATRAAQAAEEQLGIASNTAERQLRAYVLAHEAEIRDFNQIPEAQVLVRNY